MNNDYTYTREGRTVYAMDNDGTTQEAYRAIGRKVDNGYWCVPNMVYRAMKRATSDAREQELYMQNRIHIKNV